MDREKVFYIVTIGLLTTLLLPVLKFNLPFLRVFGVSIFSVQLWTILYFAICILFFKQVLFTVNMRYFYLFSVIHILQNGIRSGSLLARSPWLKSFILPLFIAITMHEIILRSRNKKNLNKFLWIIIGLIIISCVLNIRGLIVNPSAARAIIGGADSEEVIDIYLRQGITGYGFVSAIPAIIPCFFYLRLKNIKKLLSRALLLGMVLIVVTTFYSAITTAFMLSLSLLLMSYLGVSTLNKSYMFILLIFFSIAFVIYSPQLLVSNFLKKVADISPTEALKIRIDDIETTLTTGLEVTAQSQASLTTVETRFQRVYWNIEALSTSPLWGTRKVDPAAGHLPWLYFLANFGFLGFIPLVLLFYNLIKSNLQRIAAGAHYYYLLAVGSFILMGLLKNVVGSIMFIIPFTIVPVFFMRSSLQSTTVDKLVHVPN